MATSTEEDDNLTLENIEEELNDENKIVSYKWLSLSLGMPSNKAKEILEKYVAQQKEKKCNNLSVVYFIGGRLKESKDNDACKYFLVRDEELDGVKSKLDKCTCEHVYSVQKYQIKDASMLYTTDYDLVKQSVNILNKYSGIYFQENSRPPDTKFLEEERVDRSKGSEESTNFKKHLPNGICKKEKDVDQRKGNERPEKQTKASTFFGGTKSGQSKANIEVKKEKQDAPSISESTAPAKSSKTESSKSPLSFFGKPLKKKNEGKESEEKKEPKQEEKVKETNIIEVTKKDDRTEVARDRKESSPQEEETDKKSRKEHKKSSKESTRSERTKKSSKSKSSELNEDPLPDIKVNGKNKRSDLEEEPVPTKRKAMVLASDSEEDEDFETFLLKSKGSTENSRDSSSKTLELKSQENNQRKERNKRMKEESASDEEKDEEVKPKHKKKRTEKPKPMETKDDAEEETVQVKKKRKRNEEKHNSDENKESPVISSKTSSESSELREEQKVVEKPLKRKNRKRVLKSKTYMDDQGYMLTEKVYESESGSEEEEKEQEVKQPPKVQEIKTASKTEKTEPPKAKTQANLMSFFRKK